MSNPTNDPKEELTHILGNCPGMCKNPDCWFQKNSHLIDDGDADFDKIQQQAIEKLLIEARIDELDNHLGEAEFEDVPVDIIKWKWARVTELQDQLNKLEGK